MVFINGDLIILNEEGREFLRKNNMPDSYRVLKIISTNIYTEELWTQDSLNSELKYTLSSDYYQLATENDFKVYKMKCLF